MSMHYDNKGKFYTDVVSKEAVPVIIQTLTNRIRGLIHLRPGIRFKDQIVGTEAFIAITEATVYSPSGQVLYHCNFLALNRDHLVWIFPESEIVENQPS